MKSYKYTLEQLREAVKNSHSIAACLKKLNVAAHGGNYRVIRKHIKENGIDISHFTGQGWNNGKVLGPKRPIQDYLDNKYRITSYHLRNRLIAENVLEARCSVCQITEWLGQPIPLELHHIDGDYLNNNLQNLMLVCPNCHALTDNYRGKKKRREPSSPEDKPKQERPRKVNHCKLCGAVCNTRSERCRSCYRIDSRKVKRPSKEELAELLWQKPTVVLAKEFGVSDKAIAKWAKHYKLPKPPPGYWSKQKRSTEMG